MSSYTLSGAAVAMKEIPNYKIFSVIVCLWCPPLGLAALYCSFQVGPEEQKGKIENAKLYSRLAFGISFVGIFTTLLIVCMVYSYGEFPDDAYFNRDKVIADA